MKVVGDEKETVTFVVFVLIAVVFAVLRGRGLGEEGAGVVKEGSVGRFALSKGKCILYRVMLFVGGGRESGEGCLVGEEDAEETKRRRPKRVRTVGTMAVLNPTLGERLLGGNFKLLK